MVAAAALPAPARPAKRSRRGRRHSRRNSQTARVHTLGDQRAQHRRLHRGDRQIAGDRRQRQPTIGILHGAEIVDQQFQLAVARRRQHEAVKELGEAVQSITIRSVALVFVADEVQRLRGNAVELAPAHQRLFAPMRDPDLGSAGLDDRVGQLVPVGMSEMISGGSARPRALADTSAFEARSGQEAPLNDPGMLRAGRPR